MTLAVADMSAPFGVDFIRCAGAAYFLRLAPHFQHGGSISHPVGSSRFPNPVILRTLLERGAGVLGR